MFIMHKFKAVLLIGLIFFFSKTSLGFSVELGGATKDGLRDRGMESEKVADHLPNTALLDRVVVWEDIIDGVRIYHEERLKSLKPQRGDYWKRNLSSAEEYSRSVKFNRTRFRNMLGAVDQREPVSMEKKNKIAETDRYVVSEIHWSVLKEISPRPPLQKWPELDVPRKIYGEGILLEPKGKSKGAVIAIPDADQEPESLVGLKEGVDRNSQYARRLAENGYTVVVPVIIDRTNRWDDIARWAAADELIVGKRPKGFKVSQVAKNPYPVDAEGFWILF